MEDTMSINAILGSNESLTIADEIRVFMKTKIEVRYEFSLLLKYKIENIPIVIRV